MRGFILAAALAGCSSPTASAEGGAPGADGGGLDAYMTGADSSWYADGQAGADARDARDDGPRADGAPDAGALDGGTTWEAATACIPNPGPNTGPNNNCSGVLAGWLPCDATASHCCPAATPYLCLASQECYAKEADALAACAAAAENCYACQPPPCIAYGASCTSSGEGCCSPYKCVVPSDASAPEGGVCGL